MFRFAFLLLIPAQIENANEPLIKVWHLQSKEGWQRTETSHFIVYHGQERKLAEKIARGAERTRIKVNQKWFENQQEDWDPKCAIIVYQTLEEHNRLAGYINDSSGYVSITFDGARVLRSINLRCDVEKMVEVVVPHETTHAAMAGRFGTFAVPRWFDEGAAVLSEPKEQINLHYKALANLKKKGSFFSLRDIMKMKEYPAAKHTELFYAQSVVLTEFLYKERGAKTLVQFVKDGLVEGYHVALERHYQWSFTDLEANWQKFLKK